jgi:hypothetical protein
VRLSLNSIVTLMQESLQIAWDYLERTGELDNPRVASRLLGESIESMVSQGQRSRLVISNRAIAAYQKFRKADGVDVKEERALQ